MWECPGCGAADATDIQTVDVSEAARCFVRPWAELERYSQLVACISGLWGSDKARIVSCGRCALRSADPFVAGTPEFFSLVYEGKNSVHPYPSWRWEFQLTQDVVCRTKEGTVLDLGAGDGAFERRLIAAGVEASRLYATEYSPEARQALQNLGVSVTGADLLTLPPANHSVVCGHQVIQHFADLDAVFRAFDSLTGPDGVVALSVTNGIHKAAQQIAGGLFDMPPNHISTWRYSAFVSAAGRRGWEVIEYREEFMSKVESAKALAVSRTHRARQNPKSVTSKLERLAVTPRARYALMAASAATRLPAAYLRTKDSYGGSIWVLLRRNI